MSFKEYRDIIVDGDTVILYVSYDSMHALEIQAGKVHQTKFGAMKHDDVIGKKFGSKIICSKGFIHVLHPTPELWTLTLPHRTQILYSTDIAMVIYQLDLHAGSVIIESGTGSGSVSHAFLRTIAPNGHLHTFDFHEQRVEKVTEEFKKHGLGDLVTAKHRDVCKDGFGLENVADAVFLDLPSPWTAIPHAKKALKFGGRICSFSPCIEQVSRACAEMTKLGFTDLVTKECLLRTFTVRDLKMPRMKLTDNEEDDSVQFTSAVAPQMMPGHTGFLTFASLYPCE